MRIRRLGSSVLGGHSPQARRLVGLIVVAMLGASTRAFPCQCGERPSTAEALGQADFVFSGKVIGVRPTTVTVDVGGEPRSGPAQEVTFRIEKSWKGDVTSRIILISGFGTCDYAFTAHEKYLVFADEATMFTGTVASKCLPTKPIAQAAADLKDLEEARHVSAANCGAGAK